MNPTPHYPFINPSIKRPWTASFKALATLLLPLIAAQFLAGPAQAQANPGNITRISSFAYNAAGLLTQEVIEPDSAQACLTTTHGYDNFGNKTSVSTAACAGASGSAIASASAPRMATTAYGADGRFPVSTTNALGHSETKLYDARFGLPTSLKGPNQLTTTWAYDGFGRKTRETRADGTWSSWSYLNCTDTGANCPLSFKAQGAGANTVTPSEAQFPSWFVTEQTCSAANTSSCTPIAPEKRQYHDVLNRVIRVQTQGFDGGPGGAAATPTLVQDTEYNALGQIRRKSNTYYAAEPSAAVWVAYSYDALGRLTREEAPDAQAAGGIATTAMTYSGLTSITTNSKGQSKTTIKDALGRTARVTDTQGNAVIYQYDALGQLISTDAVGNITKIAYNIRGQKIRMDDPAMGVWEYQYNVFGELVQQTDSLGQSATMAYDVLGRMRTRSEPDLISNWVYDACAKGIGKLCQATSDNGYSRSHSYDSLGRAAATSTKLDTTATTSISYEAATGRVTSKTYPTGYVASYQYTALGFVKSVTGQSATGTQAGPTPQAKYEILQINAQGQITQYKYGNQVTTNKTFDAQTGRLQAITATKDGLATGGIQQNTYQYDSLSNLTARGDVNSGVQEVFAYDDLNRLVNYQAVGGAVTSQNPSSNVDVRYDARGNITYKSDVGRYWYDPLRPNRLTNITLEALPGAAALTGTRALAYAFDDYLPGAKTLSGGMGVASGSVMGNGNLMYTVSQDNATGRHSVRWETYTSFNMPKLLALNSLGQAQTSTAATLTSQICPAGSTLTYIPSQEGNYCQTPSGQLFDEVATYSCPAGTTLSGNRCYSNNIITSSVTNRTLTFTYGPEHQRIKQRTQLDATAPANLSAAAGTVYYLNGQNNDLGYEKEIKDNGLIEHKHYLSAGGITFALQVTRTGNLATGGTGGSAKPAQSLQYLHADHLGSVAVVTDDSGSVIERLAFDPWGKRRFPNGMADSSDSIVGLTLDRGYTLHEHLDEMGVIHMNGRIYDPLIGRFMSADPFIQAPENLQSHNRYAYVMNNPLSYTDPSGYFSFKQLFRTALAIAAVVVLGPGGYAPFFSTVGGSAVAAGFANAALAGFVSGVIQTGTLKGGFQGAFTAVVFYGIGNLAQAGQWSDIGRIGAHAAGGCITSVASGGQCGSGALAAGFGKFATLYGPGWVQNPQGFEQVVSGAAYTAVAGGVGSVLAGGKFENGAVTGAFGYLFNFLAHRNQGVGRYGKETFDVSTELSPGESGIGALARGSFGRLLDAVRFVQGVYQDLKCGNTDCYGTRSLPDYQRAEALKVTEAQIRATVNTYVTEVGANPSQLTRPQFDALIRRFDSIPNFEKYYGNAQSILDRFPVKEVRPSCARGDTC